MIISSPLYTQSATANIPAYQYGEIPSSSYAASAPVTLGSYTDAPVTVASFASQIAGAVYNAVMDFLGPVFGVEQSQSSYLSDSFVPYATTTKKPKTFLDKLIAWFGSIGDLGNNISKGMKAGREVLNGVQSAFTWLSENNLGDAISKIGTGITDGISSIGESISGAAKSVWDWLF